MKLGVVTGTVVSTIKYEKYVGYKLLKKKQIPALVLIGISAMLGVVVCWLFIL